MDCPEENVIVDFVRGELPKTERAAIEAHIDECGACSQLVAEMARIFADDEPAGSRAPLSAPLLSGQTFATDGAFSPSSATIGGAAALDEQLLPQGSKLGRYVVIDRVGAGGMGVVYAAYDPELDRKVALKVLRSTPTKPGARNDQRARLIREAQAMAKLSHPNVITVHDVGTFEEQVFIAMEFIEGGTLGDWLSQQRRSWREVQRVFRASGEGLEAAHEVGLVHRDFKPDNVLMGTDGRVLVTDFGLARPAAGHTGRFADLSHADSNQGLLHASLTRTGALVGTPAYMAPEQLHGRSTSALTDQFSFCVALYEALYGERPFEGQALVELVHNVSEGNIRPAPRDSNTPRWLRRAVLQGLQTEPKDRHPSMGALLVALRKDPWRAWRRWGTVTIPTAVLGIGLMAYQQVERAAETSCDQVAEMLAGVWDDSRAASIQQAFGETSRPYASDTFTTIKGALDDYADAWISEQSRACHDELRAEQPQAVLALRMNCLERRLGSLEAITDLLVAADADTVAAALDAVRSLPAIERCSDLEALTERADVALDSTARDIAEEIDHMVVEASVRSAAAKYAQTTELAETIIERSQAAGYRRGEAEGLYYLGRAKLALGQRDDAEKAFHRAFSASLAAGHSEVMAQASVGLVWISGERGLPLDVAERWAAHGLAALQQMGGHPRIEAELYQAIAASRHKAGKYELGDEALNRGLDALNKLDTPEQQRRGGLLTAKASLLLTRGLNDEALAVFEQAIEVIREGYGERHPNTATALDNLGTAMSAVGRNDEALQRQQGALAIRAEALGLSHVSVGGSHQNLSITLVRIGELEGAREHAEQAVAVMERVLGTQSLELASALSQLAYVERILKDHDGSVAHLERALAMTIAVGGNDHPKATQARFMLGSTFADAGEYERARDLLQLAADERTLIHGDNSAKTAQALSTLADVHNRLGQYDKAVLNGERAIKSAESVSASKELAAARFVLAQALVRIAEPDLPRARSLAEMAREYYATADPDNAVHVATWLAEQR